MTQNSLMVVYHRLNELTQRDELDFVIQGTFNSLNSAHLSAIVNAFFLSTKICINGIPYIAIRSLSVILRTGNSGAERPLVYQGICGVISPAEIIEIDGIEHISGPTLRSLIDTRMLQSDGRTKMYLKFAMQSYERILNLSQVRDLKEVFLDDIKNNRPLLKTQRIATFNISCCEFTGELFNNPQEVEFAHIQSVVTNPMLALDINNGVIILKGIHRELTKLGIHDYDGMYQFCKNQGYLTNWSD